MILLCDKIMKIIIFSALFGLVSFQLHAEKNEYLMTDICRATLNVMLKRDLSIMNSTSLGDGSARVQFTRPQDGKRFSYLCRSTDGHTIGVLDETLTRPRWYGELPADIQRSYSIKAGNLIIRTSYQGNISDELFSHNEFPVISGGSNDESTILQQYGDSLEKSFHNGNIKMVKAYHVMSKPLNTYRIDFDTSEKKLLSQPGADKNNAIYQANLNKTKAWVKAFCTPELRKIMNEKSIDIVSGIITNRGNKHSISPCFK